MDKKIVKNESGLTLVEVMVALLIFSFFIVAFVITNGANLTYSRNFKDELKLRDLAVGIINETIVNPPELTEGLTLSPETKKFENEKDYSYTITWKKFELPDFTKMSGEENSDDPRQAFQKKVFEQVKENMEKMVWQLAVEVKSENTNMTYRLATWVYNEKAAVSLSGF
ncbi:MAG: hypothetical protein CME70_23045 [Halobacteriovorax sp.]|nr:hypothetical protein [Halobacteriovorax sp.]